VFEPNRNFGIFLPVFQQHQPAAGFQRGTHRAQHLLGLGDFVVHVDHQNEIDG
jgi:hypothetical protein